MQRVMFKSKIHRATVTDADLNYDGSITIDQDLMEAADLIPNEWVHVWNITNGHRFETYAIHGERGSGTICLNGAAARMASKGDLVIIASYVHLDEDEVADHQPKVILVDEKNRNRDRISMVKN